MMYIVYITCKNLQEAKKIAKHLLEKRLIGCANIIPSIISMYWWRGKIENEKESLILCKTSKKLISKVKAETKKIHSYNIPCIEFIKVADQNKNYSKCFESEFK